MSYFSYHGRNKKKIREGYLENYFYLERDNKKVLILVFKDGRKFPVKDERWREYDEYIHKYYGRKK